MKVRDWQIREAFLNLRFTPDFKLSVILERGEHAHCQQQGTTSKPPRNGRTLTSTSTAKQFIR